MEFYRAGNGCTRATCDNVDKHMQQPLKTEVKTTTTCSAFWNAWVKKRNKRQKSRGRANKIRKVISCRREAG